MATADAWTTQEIDQTGCSKRSTFSPAQPRRAKTRLLPGKAAGSVATEGWNGLQKIRSYVCSKWPSGEAAGEK